MFRKNKNRKLLPLIAFGGAFALWGLNTPLVKISVDAISVPLLLCVKFLFAAIIFSVISRKNNKRIKPKVIIKIIIATLFGYVLAMALFYQGIKLTGGLNGSLIYLLAPLVLYFLSMEFLKERYDSRLLLAVFAGLTGSMLIIVGPIIGTNSAIQGSIIGNMLVLGAIFADVAGTIIIKPILRKIPTAQITAFRFWVASIILLPFAAKDINTVASIEFSTSVLVAVLYNLIFGTLIAFYAYHWGLRRITGEQASPLSYLDPLVGTVGSILILGDQLTTVSLAGIILVVSGIYFGEFHKKSKYKHASHHK